MDILGASLKMKGVDYMSFYYSNEIVFRGHPWQSLRPNKWCTSWCFLKQDKHSRCGIETVGGKGKIFVTGEVTSRALVNVTNIVKEALRDVGYDPNKYEVIDNIGKQSPDIAQGVDAGGAGDQGMMFGYACRDTVDYIPTAMAILQDLSAFYDRLVKIDDRFLPDGKAQITGFYDENNKLEYIRILLSHIRTKKQIEQRQIKFLLTTVRHFVQIMELQSESFTSIRRVNS